MKKSISTLLVVLLTTLVACGGKETKDTVATRNSTEIDPNDKTVYGLACDGCTDTILVLLRDIESDPDTFNILQATKYNHVMGRPSIGANMAVVLNAEDSTVADLVINLEELKASWCYMVKPKLRQRASLASDNPKTAAQQLPDSVIKKFMVPREYGFQLKAENVARPIGMVHRNGTEEESPVEYPILKRYREWHLFNGNLVLTETALDSLGNAYAVNSDTAQFLLMTPDTLVLRFNDGDHGFYKKIEKL
jgi:hypothetical protein